MPPIIKPGETERVADRKVFSKKMTRPDNKTVVRIFGQPLHWDDSGTLRDIDMTPTDRGSDYRAVDGLYEVTVEKNRPGFVYTSRAGGEVSTHLQGVTAAPILDTRDSRRIKFTWIDAFKDIDVEIQLRPGGVWTYTSIKTSTAIHEFVWSLTTDGLGAKDPRLESALNISHPEFISAVDVLGERTITIDTVAAEFLPADYPLVVF